LLGVPKLDKDCILVSGLTIVAGPGPRENRLKNIGYLRDGQVHIGGFLAVYQDKLFGVARFPADSGVRNPIEGFDDIFDLSGQTVRRLKVVAANFNLDFVRALRTQAKDKQTLVGSRPDNHTRHLAQSVSQIR